MQEVKRVWVVYNARRPEAKAQAQNVIRLCEREGLAVEAGSELPLSGATPDLVITVGGDGTVLRTAAGLYPQEVPILPVHFGGVGFLSAVEATQFEGALAALRAGRAQVERRLRLLAQGPGFSGTALNEIAVVGPGQQRFVEVSLFAGGEALGSFGGDGVLLATPTGSTAYALAAGGPILVPHLPALLLVPLNPHKLGLRPLVLAGDGEVRVRAERQVLILADGDPIGAVSPGKELLVRRAPRDTLLVRLPQTPGLFSRLREKLGWP
ncbi:MAG: NAD(+)/NADH kinase [Candidatus Bipolaricaulaceae bacterium]